MVKDNREINTVRMRLVALALSVVTVLSPGSTLRHSDWPIVHDWWYFRRFIRNAGVAVT
jgi:hypothetical protein